MLRHAALWIAAAALALDPFAPEAAAQAPSAEKPPPRSSGPAAGKQNAAAQGREPGTGQAAGQRGGAAGQAAGQAQGRRGPGQAGPGGPFRQQRARALAQAPARPETVPPELASVSESGDPVALALSEDGSRIFSLEGASLVTLDARQPTLPEIARAPLDATVLAMVAAGTELYVAGGTHGVGLLAIEPPPPAPPAADGAPAPSATAPAAIQWLDRAAGKPCTSVAVAGGLLLATFASERESELRIYLRGKHQLAGSVALSGRALDVAVQGTFAYLAMGQLGVVRADLRFLKAPKLAAGPDLTRVAAPEHFKLRRGFARDVAVGGSALYVAADVAGLVEIDLRKPWGTTDSFVARPLAFLGRPAYAIRVDARGEQVAVASARVPALVGDGAPHGLLGGIGWDLVPGSVPFDDWQPGASEVLWIFQHRDGGALELAAVEPIEDSTWRALALRGRRVYEQHAKLGLVVRELAPEPRVASAGDARVPLQGSLSIVGRRKPRGIACLDGKPSLVDPRLFFFGADPSSSDSRGFLRMGQGERLAPVPELATQPPVGASVGAQWPDTLTSREWFVSGAARGWRVQRFTHRPRIGLDTWEIVPPVPEDAGDGGARGRMAFHSARDGDLLLATHDGTRYGLIGYSIEQLTKLLAETRPGGRVIVQPLWQLPTHFEGERAACSTWRACVFALEDGRRIAAIAAGANTNPESEHFEAPQLVLYDVTNGSATTPRLLSVAWGPEKRGLAVAVDVCAIRRRSYAAVATTGGELLIFDVNMPDKARYVRSYKSPNNAYDGDREPLLDVEIATDRATERSFAYLAAARAGFLRVELTAAGGELAPDTMLDTPGFASGVASTLIGDERYWLVGDARGGLRLYR